MRTLHAPARHASGTRPALLAIAHGSHDPRHTATVAALCARLRGRRPELRVCARREGFPPAVTPPCDALSAVVCRHRQGPVTRAYAVEARQEVVEETLPHGRTS